jgi:hypothetical protein
MAIGFNDLDDTVRKVSGGFAVGSVGGDYYFDRSW